VLDRWRYSSLHRYFSLPLSFHNEVDSGEAGELLNSSGGMIWWIMHIILGHDILITVSVLLIYLMVILFSFPGFLWIFLPPLFLFGFVRSFTEYHMP